MSSIDGWDGPSIKRARYARGWSQKVLASKLVACAGDLGVPIPGSAGVAMTVANWESGRNKPGDNYQMLLVFTLGEHQLPAMDSEEYGKLLVLPGVDGRLQARTLQEECGKAASLTPEQIDQLVHATGELRQLDRHGNAPATIAKMHLHIDCLDQLVRGSIKPAERRVLASTLADAMAIAGWAALDRGLPRDSLKRLVRAEEVAAFADDQPLRAFASGQRAYVLIDQGDCRQAQELVTDVLGTYRRSLPPELVAWLYGALAEAAAVNGDATLCKDSLDNGRARLAAAGSDGEFPYVVLSELHFERWAGSCLAKLGDREAIGRLERVRDEIHPDFVRALGGVLVDLTQVYVAQGELDAAATVFDAAVDTAGVTGSVRQLSRLRTLHEALASCLLPRAS